MMPTSFQFIAPKYNTDNTPLVQPVEYEVGILLEDTSMQVLFQAPGELQDSGYTLVHTPEGLEDLEPGEYTFAVRAVNVEEGIVSEWSGTDSFVVSNGEPRAPTSFSVVE